MGTHRAQADLETLLGHTGWLRALAAELIGDSHRAEDVVQETIVAALLRPPSPSPDADGLRAWLGRVARNFARLSLRSDRRRVRRERAVARSERVPSVADMVERFERQREIVEAVTSLEPCDREVIVLRYFEELPPRDIARRLGVTPGVVRTRLSRARGVLRARLDQSHDGDRAAWAVPIAAWLRDGAVPAGPSLPVLMGLLSMKRGSKVLIGLAAVIVASLATVFWAQGLGGVGPLPSSSTERAAASPSSVDASETPGDHERRPVERRPSGGGGAVAEPALVLRARCVRPDTTPVAGVALSIADREETSERSGSDGRVELSLPWAGLAGAEEAGPVALELRFFGEREVEVRRELQPTGPGVVALGDVVLEPAGSLVGQVLGFDGAPRAGVEVNAVSAFVDAEPGMLEEARVYGFWTHLDNSRSWSGRTDAAGRYRLQGVPTSFVSVRAKAVDSYFAFSQPVAVTEGETATVPDIRLEQTAFDNLVRGQVLDPDGRPLTGVRVSLIEPSRAASHPSRASTDDDGLFTLLVPAGRDFLAVARGGDRWNDAEARVRGGDRKVTLRFEEPRWLRVMVRDRTGERLAEARARAVSKANGPWRPMQSLAGPASAEDDGVRVSVPGRTFYLEVSAQGYRTSHVGPFDPVRVNEAVEVALERAGGLRGRVLVDGEPSAGAVVHAHVPWWAGYRGRATAGFVSRLQGPWRQARSGADGSFLLALDRSGAYVLHVELPGRARAEVGPVDYVAGAEHDLGEIELGLGGAVSGHVLVGAGVEVAGTVVGATSGDGHVHTCRVDEQGRFRIEGLRAGTYQVLAFEPEQNPGQFQIEREERGDPVVWNARVEDGRDTSCVIDLRDREPVRFAIEVRFGGKPPVNWSAAIHGSRPRQINGRLDAEGRWTGTMTRHGDFQVTCFGPFGAQLRPSVNGPISIRPAVGGVVSWRFDVEAGTVRLVDLPLPEPGASPGLVAREQMRLCWTGSSGKSWWLPLHSATGGRLTVPDVPAGHLVLRRRPAGGGGGGASEWPVVLEFDLASGESKEVVVR